MPERLAGKLPAFLKRILIAPAAFKGTLSAPEAATIIADALTDVLRETFSGSPLPEKLFDLCPIADGGDDTLTVLFSADPGFEKKSCTVTGPLADQTVDAGYLIHPARNLAVIEAAQAHGLTLLPDGHPEPLQTTSYGVGELIRHALEDLTRLGNPQTEKTLVVTLGGSASTDGGTGALQALGARFFDSHHQLLTRPLAGQDLLKIASAELPEQFSHEDCQLLIATDVKNPLLGKTGTAAVYAPQKGAGPKEIEHLEAGLKNLSDIFWQATDVDLTTWPGVGAAGGLAYGLYQLPGASITSGAEWVGNFLKLKQRVQQADLIITGEGRFDAQSLSGKGTGFLLKLAHNKPVILICGQRQPEALIDASAGEPTITENIPQDTVHIISLAEALNLPLEALIQEPEETLRAGVKNLLTHFSN